MEAELKRMLRSIIGHCCKPSPKAQKGKTGILPQMMATSIPTACHC